MSIFSTVFRYRDKKSPDKLGLYPERFHINSFPERRYLWTSRILVIFAVISFCMTIILTMTIYLLLPQKTSSPMFYKINQVSYGLEQVQSSTTAIKLRDLLTEKYIDEYVRARHAIPRSTADLYYRWDTNSKFYWYSGLRNYYDFVNKQDKDQLKTFIRLRMRRKVEIEQIRQLTDNLWMAAFKTYTSTKDMPEPDIINWRAYLRIQYLEFDKYEDIEKTEEEKLDYTTNPFGFKVMQYSLTYAGKPQKSDDALHTAKKVFENLEDVVK